MLRFPSYNNQSIDLQIDWVASIWWITSFVEVKTNSVIRICTSALSLPKKCPYLEFFWAVFSRIRSEYGKILRIQSKYEEIWTRKTPNTDNFHAVYIITTAVPISLYYHYHLSYHDLNHDIDIENGVKEKSENVI